jgi:hypothetical protein
MHTPDASTWAPCLHEEIHVCCGRAPTQGVCSIRQHSSVHCKQCDSFIWRCIDMMHCLPASSSRHLTPGTLGTDAPAAVLGMCTWGWPWSPSRVPTIRTMGFWT